MPLWLISIALKGAGIMRNAADWLVHNPMVAALLVALAWGGIEHHEAAKWYRVAHQLQNALDAVPAAQAAALAEQKAEDARVLAQYRKEAETADANYNQAKATADAAVAAYIAAHRVRAPANPRDAGAGDHPAETGGGQLPAGLPADAVLVSSADLHACTDATTYAVTAHNDAMTKLADGSAITEAEAAKSKDQSQ